MPLTTMEHSRLLYLLEALRSAPAKHNPLLDSARSNIEGATPLYIATLERLSKSTVEGLPALIIKIKKEML